MPSYLSRILESVKTEQPAAIRPQRRATFAPVNAKSASAADTSIVEGWREIERMPRLRGERMSGDRDADIKNRLIDPKEKDSEASHIASESTRPEEPANRIEMQRRTQEDAESVEASQLRREDGNEARMPERGARNEKDQHTREPRKDEALQPVPLKAEKQAEERQLHVVAPRSVEPDRELRPRRDEKRSQTRKEASPAAPPQAPQVSIHIGRIEVRAVLDQPAKVTERPRPAPLLTLDEYLAKRNGERS